MSNRQNRIRNKIPDTSGLIKKQIITEITDKITEIERKIPDVSNLATKTALTTVENKIPSVISIVKKTDYNRKITEIEKKLTDHNPDKYIATPKFNTLAASVFNARLAQVNWVTKTNFHNTVSSLNNKIAPNKRKNESI